MLKFIYYFFGVVAILYEWWAIYNFKTIRALSDKVKKTPKENITTALTQNEKVFVGLQMLYMMWVFVGLFSFQWIIFMFIFLLSILNHWFKTLRAWNVIDSVLTIAALVFAIVNTYHLHINVFQKLLAFLN